MMGHAVFYMVGYSIFDKMKVAGVEIGHHESDLYVPVTPLTREILRTHEFKSNATTFTSQIPPHDRWYDIPFAYQPFWDAVQRRVTYQSPPCK